MESFRIRLGPMGKQNEYRHHDGIACFNGARPELSNLATGAVKFSRAYVRYEDNNKMFETR